MKIGVICHDAFPIAEPYQGGLEMITAILVKELNKRGHQVSSLCLKGSELAGDMYYYEELEGFDEELSEELKSLGSFSNSLNKFILKDFDILHNNSMHYQSIILGNITNIPYVTTFHTPVFSSLNLGILSISANLNQTFVGVSNWISTLYEQYIPKVITVYNGIDLTLWETSYEEYDDYYSWCGRVCKEKGLAELMIFCLQENIKLKIAGPISEPSYYNSEIVPLLEEDNFEYLGHLEQSEVNKLIKKSKAYIFSSIWDEPYGLVIAEALASGVPVLASSVGAAPEIIDSSSGVLFDLKNINSFRSGLDEINKLSRQDCRRRAEEFCSHHRMVDDYEKLFFELKRGIKNL